MWETLVQSQSWEDPLEKGMGTHSSILAWRIPRQRILGYGPWVHKESDNGDAIQPSRPLLPPSPFAVDLSQHQSLFQ